MTGVEFSRRTTELRPCDSTDDVPPVDPRPGNVDHELRADMAAGGTRRAETDSPLDLSLALAAEGPVNCPR